MIKSAIGYYLQNVHHKGKRHATRLLLKLLPVRDVQGFYGIRMRTCPSDKTNIYALCGEYGRTVSDHLSSIPDGDVFIDIGTNHGVFSLMVASRNPKSDVISFEPNPHIYRYFLENIALNSLKNIIAFHSAVGPEDGIMGLEYDPRHSGKAHVSNDKRTGIRIPVMDISKSAAISNIIGNRNVHIKIDVEGFEKNIIDTIIKAPWFLNVKSLVVEIDHDNLRQFGSTAEQIHALVKNAGLKPTIGLQSAHYDEIFKA